MGGRQDASHQQSSTRPKKSTLKRLGRRFGLTKTTAPPEQQAQSANAAPEASAATGAATKPDLWQEAIDQVRTSDDWGEEYAEALLAINRSGALTLTSADAILHPVSELKETMEQKQ